MELSPQSDSYYFNNLDTAFDLHSHYDKKLKVEDFNPVVSGNVLNTFLSQHDHENLVKDKLASKMQIILAPLAFL